MPIPWIGGGDVRDERRRLSTTIWKLILRWVEIEIFQKATEETVNGKTMEIADLKLSEKQSIFKARKYKGKREL